MKYSDVAEIIHPDSQAPVVFLCEHASNHIPDDYGDLGLSKADLAKHIAWDIGAADLTRNLASHFQAGAILATFSRLLVDANREPDHGGLIPAVSDNIIIPGNQDLSEDEIERRMQRFYHPFHDACLSYLDDHPNLQMVIGIHSFTPEIGGFKRPWPIGLLWNKDRSLSLDLLRHFLDRGVNIGDNLPYSGKDLFYTLNHHGGRRDVPHVGIEIRQNGLDTAAGVDAWTEALIYAIEGLIKKHTGEN